MKQFATYKTGAFLQKTCERFPLDATIRSMAVTGDGVLYGAGEGGLFRLEGGKWFVISEDGFSAVFCHADGRVFASCGNKLFEIDGDSAILRAELDGDIRALGGEDGLFILTDDALYTEKGGVTELYRKTDFKCFALVQSGSRICIANARSVQRLEGKRKTWRCIFPDHSAMPDITVNTIAFDKMGYLWVGAREGLFIYDYKSGWYSHSEIEMLPCESVSSIAFFDCGDALLGTDAGAVLLSGGTAKYLPARRYAFSADVTAVAVHGGIMYTASEGGVIMIKQTPMTLEEKADYLFRETEKYFPRKEGYVTGIRNVKNGDILSAAPAAITDNDGLWTQSYIAALSMCYAVTGNKEVLRKARRSIRAMLFLTKAAEIDGFTARAVRYPDEQGFGQGLEEQAIGAEWHRSSDGTYEWLGETSSDEMTGHYMGFSLYYDLCADENEKEEIKTAICGITDHIINNGGYLFDCDGQPTTWACWNPEALNNDSMWMWEKGLNSLQMLTFLKVAHHMSGDKKYLDIFDGLVREHHFLLNAAFHKKDDGHSCHIDDNLGMCISLTLLRLEKDTAVRSWVLAGLSSHWNYERIEGNPFYSFIYGAFTGRPCDIDTAVAALCDYPLDFLSYRMINSKRRNLAMSDETERWGEKPHLRYPLAWDERALSRMGTDPFALDGGNESKAESGLTYLLIYWFGRYSGLIE